MNKEEILLDIMEKMHDSVKSIEAKINEIQIELVRQNVIVERHEARSTASEENNRLLEQKLDERLARLEKKELMINGGIKVILAIGSLVGFLLGIFKLT